MENNDFSRNRIPEDMMLNYIMPLNLLNGIFKDAPKDEQVFNRTTRKDVRNMNNEMNERPIPEELLKLIFDEKVGNTTKKISENDNDILPPRDILRLMFDINNEKNFERDFETNFERSNSKDKIFETSKTPQRPNIRINKEREVGREERLERIDIMVDIETLGKGDMPPVIQLAATAFDIKTGKIINRFEQFADVKTINNIEGDTLSWWLNTDKELLTKIINKGIGGVSQKEMIKQFCDWVKSLTKFVDEKHIFLWGNGVLFDNRIIKNKCSEYGFEYPIFYRNDLDCRTVFEVAAMKLGLKSQTEFRDMLEHEGTYHDAADDVSNQINDLVCAFSVLIS